MRLVTNKIWMRYEPLYLFQINNKFKKLMKNSNQKANINNANKGTKGTNKTYDKAQGNRGKQLNPNQSKKK